MAKISALGDTALLKFEVPRDEGLTLILVVTKRGRVLRRHRHSDGSTEGYTLLTQPWVKLCAQAAPGDANAWRQYISHQFPTAREIAPGASRASRAGASTMHNA